MQRTLLLYKWFGPVGGVVVIQMRLLRGTGKQCQFFSCVERTIKKKQIILCGLINSSVRPARSMNLLHVAWLKFFFQKAGIGEELWFLSVLCCERSLGDMARVKRVC